MEAIIYAAGVGRRLEKQFGECPKILLEFEGRTLLERHVQRLVENDVKQLTLVTGYQRDLIHKEAVSLQDRYDIAISETVNPDFSEGSILSFHASIPLLEAIQEPVLLMDADVLYPGDMLRRLITSDHSTALLVDRDYSTADDDPVLVPVSGGRPFDFVKGWEGEAEWIGESIGFFKVSPYELPLLITETRRLLAADGRALSYDDVLRVMVQADRFGCEDVTGVPWTELDFPGDIERAKREVLPAVMNWNPAAE